MSNFAVTHTLGAWLSFFFDHLYFHVKNDNKNNERRHRAKQPLFKPETCTWTRQISILFQTKLFWLKIIFQPAKNAPPKYFINNVFRAYHCNEILSYNKYFISDFISLSNIFGWKLTKISRWKFFAGGEFDLIQLFFDSFNVFCSRVLCSYACEFMLLWNFLHAHSKQLFCTILETIEVL